MDAICVRGDPGADKTIVVYGNSHGRMWIPAFERIADREHYRTVYLVKPNCAAPLIVVGDLANGRRAVGRRARTSSEWAMDQIEELQPELVVVASSGPNPVVYDDDGNSFTTDEPEYDELTRAGYEDLFTRLAAMADRTVLIRDLPKNPDDPGTCLTSASPDLGDCLWTPLAASEVDADVSVEAAEATGTDYVDPTRWVCWEGDARPSSAT